MAEAVVYVTVRVDEDAMRPELDALEREIDAEMEFGAGVCHPARYDEFMARIEDLKRFVSVDMEE